MWGRREERGANGGGCGEEDSDDLDLPSTMLSKLYLTWYAQTARSLALIVRK